MNSYTLTTTIIFEDSLCLRLMQYYSFFRHESYANLSMCMNRAHPGQEKDRKDSGSKSAGSQVGL